jgi:hypothetical protein
MKLQSRNILRDTQGKGMVGCLIFLVLTVIAVFLAIQVVPIYYANYTMESEIRTEVSRAGARFLEDETIVSDIRAMAKNNNIPLEKENIKIQRLAGQVVIDVNYSVRVDFVIFERDLNFNIRASSFVGTL